MELLENYREYLMRYSECTRKNRYKNIMLYLRYLKEVKGDDSVITICNVTRADIYNYVAYMDHLSKNTKRARLYAIKNFYSFINPYNDLFEDIKLFETPKRLPRCLSLAQAKKLINYYKDDRNRLIIYIFLTTGIRLSELTKLRVSDINLKEKTMFVRCKGGKTRDVMINDKLKDMLENYIKDKDGSLFTIGNRAVQEIVTKAMRETGCKGSVHTLRHTAATLMYQNTQDVLIVKEFLGHSSICSTQIYTHINNNNVRAAVNSNPLAYFGVEAIK